MQANTQAELDAIYQASSFYRGEVAWQEMKIEEVDGEDYPLGIHIYVPECTYLGETLISLADTYEGSGEDCLFIQELLRLYKEGRLKVVKKGKK